MVFTSIIFCFCIMAIYVSSFYLQAVIFKRFLVHRNEPIEIRRRIVCIIVATMMIVGLTKLFINEETLTSFLFLRFDQDVGYKMLTSTITTLVLLFGPLFEVFVSITYRYLCEPSPSSTDETWVFIRNFLVAPLTEELVFRSCVCSLLLGTGYTTYLVALILNPLIFSMAHLHHHFDELKALLSQKRKWGVIIPCIYQVTCTWIFSIYTSFVLLYVGNVFAPVIVHVLCNLAGSASFSWLTVLVYGRKHVKNQDIVCRFPYIFLMLYIIGLISGFVLMAS